MSTHADKTQENKSQSVSNGFSQKEGSSESTFQFADNRPLAITQSKMQEMVNNSSQVSQLRVFQEMADNHSQVKKTVLADNHSDQQVIQRIGNNTDQQETENKSSQAKSPPKLKKSEIMLQMINGQIPHLEGDETKRPSLADYSAQVKLEDEEKEREKKEAWDIVERDLPSVEEFARQTDAGLSARRDDLLLEIDKKLERCNFDREKLNSQIVEVNELEKDAKVDKVLKDDTKKGVDLTRIFYNQKLDILQKSVDTWLKQFQGDTTSSVIHRRTSIEALLLAIKSEKVMTIDERVQSVKEMEVKKMERAKEESEKKEKAYADVRSRPPFTAEEFKAEAQIWVALPFTNIGNVVSGLKVFHAIKPGRDKSIQLNKLETCNEVSSAAAAAYRKIYRLKAHPGYEKGFMGFEKKSHDILQDALSKLLGQCYNYYNKNRTP